MLIKSNWEEAAMLSLNQILNEMKNKKSYFTKAYHLNMTDINAKEIEWGIKFTYRDKKFLLVKQIGKPNGYILKGNYVIAKIDLRYPENIFTYMVLKECDNSLDNSVNIPIKVINPNINIFKLSFCKIFTKLGRNKINIIKTINAK